MDDKIQEIVDHIETGVVYKACGPLDVLKAFELDRYNIVFAQNGKSNRTGDAHQSSFYFIGVDPKSISSANGEIDVEYRMVGCPYSYKSMKFNKTLGLYLTEKFDESERVRVMQEHAGERLEALITRSPSLWRTNEF